MATNFQRLWNDVKSANDEAKAVRALTEIVTEKAGRVFVSQSDREDAEYCIDVLGRGIAGNHLETTVEKQAFFVTLMRLAGTHGRLPDSMMITENVQVEDKIVANGGFADVRRGRYMGHLVAVKTLRTEEVDDIPKIRKQFCKEVILWSTLSHPHILKLMGVYGDIDKGQFIAVSEWMANGNIMEYIKKNYVNRLELLYGAAQGLKYIHDAGLTHGDLKGANILMSNDKPPRACLADFGFMTMVLDPHKPMSCSAQLEGGTVPFTPPELLVPSKFKNENPVPAPAADVYGFGMVILQVLTGEIPFRRIRRTELTFSVVQGLRPEKPENALAIGLSESLWNFVQRCWDQDRDLRPRVAGVVKHLARATRDWHGLMPPCSVVENGTPASEEAMSNTMQYAGIYIGTSTDAPESPNSQASSLFSHSGSPFTVFTASPREEAQEIVANPPAESSTGRQGSLRRRPVLDELAEAHYLTYDFKPPPSQFPPVRKQGEISKRLKSALFPMFGKPALSSKPPLEGLAKITAESRRRPNQDLIDEVDRMLENAAYDRDWHRLLNILCKTCSNLRTLPKSMHVGDCLEGETDEENYGGQAKVFRGKHKGRAVAVKIPRLYLSGDLDKRLREFCREAVAWRHLPHPNILPLLGVNLEPDQFSMISEWMDHGNINEFLKRHEGVNRVQLLIDAANGLEYMHGLRMVHGDLKGANILIKESSRACLADFGLSTIIGVGRRAGTGISFFGMASQESLMSFTPGGTVGWMSPELQHPERFGKSDDRPTKGSDCYALGMVVYEVLCGKDPYWEIERGALVTMAILAGKQPRKPEAGENLGFTNGLWGIMERSWSADAGTRPDVRTILVHLNHASWIWERKPWV